MGGGGLMSEVPLHSSTVPPCMKVKASPDAGRKGQRIDDMHLKIIEARTWLAVCVANCSTVVHVPVQGYLAHKRPPPPRTLEKASALGPSVVLGGGAVSYERGTPVREKKTWLLGTGGTVAGGGGGALTLFGLRGFWGR